MKRPIYRLLLLVALGPIVFWSPNAQSQQKPGANTVQVHLVITDEAVREDKELPPLQLEDVKVKEGKNPLKVTHLIPATDENAALQLMILIDDTLNTSVGNSLTELKEFITAQPPSTVIAIGYMANAGVNVAQNFTPDHALAVTALRLPRGSLSTMDSPYLSLISLVKSWPQQKVRREVLMVSDGIDRLRGEKPELSSLGPDFGAVYHRPNYNRGFSGASYRAAYETSAIPAYQTMPSTSIDAPSASKSASVTTFLSIRFMRPVLDTRAEALGTSSLVKVDSRRLLMKPAETFFRSELHSSSASSLILKLFRKCWPINITWYSKLCRRKTTASNA